VQQRDLVATVADRAGGMAEDDARAAIGAIVPAIAGACSERVARRIASALDGTWSRFERGPAESVEGVHGMVAARLELPMGRAAELTRVVGELIGERLDDEGWALARRDLAPELLAILEPRTPVGRPGPRTEREPTSDERTLAAGAPGAQRPIAAAHHPVAQPASVDDDAQHDERLATAHGTRQEERGETLATGRPGSTRPLSTGR
jgi:hypothetical protein